MATPVPSRQNVIGPGGFGHHGTHEGENDDPSVTGIVTPFCYSRLGIIRHPSSLHKSANCFDTSCLRTTRLVADFIHLGLVRKGGATWSSFTSLLSLLKNTLKNFPWR